MRINHDELLEGDPSTLEAALRTLADEEPADDRPDESSVEHEKEGLASLEVAAVAEERGLHVTRLLDSVIVCSDGSRDVAFRGFAGSTTSRIALAMCRSDAWVRRYLEPKGVPVAATRLVEQRRPTQALRAADELGYPVALRAAEDAFDSSTTVTGRAEFRKAWEWLRERELEHRMQIIIEHPPNGLLCDVAVVAGLAVAVAVHDSANPLTDDPHNSATARAVEVLGNLPKIDYASVRLAVEQADSGPSGVVVLGVDPLLQAWAERPDRTEIARAVLEHEFGGTRDD